LDLCPVPRSQSSLLELAMEVVAPLDLAPLDPALEQAATRAVAAAVAEAEANMDAVICEALRQLREELHAEVNLVADALGKLDVRCATLDQFEEHERKLTAFAEAHQEVKREIKDHTRQLAVCVQAQQMSVETAFGTACSLKSRSDRGFAQSEDAGHNALIFIKNELKTQIYSLHGDLDKLTTDVEELKAYLPSSGTRENLLELQQRVSSCERMCDDLARATGQGHLSGRLKEVGAELERSLAEHRALAVETQRALAEHKAETQQTLAQSLGAQKGELSARLAEHRSLVRRQVEKSALEQRQDAEMVFEAQKATLERMLAEHRLGQSDSDHCDLASRMEHFKKLLDEHDSTSPSQVKEAEDLGKRLDCFEKQFAEHCSATSSQVNKSDDLTRRFEYFVKQFADHCSATSSHDLARRFEYFEKQCAEHCSVRSSPVEQAGDLAGRSDACEAQHAKPVAAMEKVRPGDSRGRLDACKKQVNEQVSETSGKEKDSFSDACVPPRSCAGTHLISFSLAPKSRRLGNRRVS